MAFNTKTLTILGATGSVGQSTLDLVRAHPDKFRVKALTANQKVCELAELAREFNVEFVALGDQNREVELKQALAGTNIQYGCGPEALIEAARLNSDFVMAAIIGTAGLPPTYEAIKRGATIGLANKECLVSAGELVMATAHEHGARILPVDSEHNALYQVFDFVHPETIDQLILTASGGPFLDRKPDELGEITPAQAVAHPKWDMGSKISVDSATMMNKGLEVIEAYHLFPIDKNQISVVVHPQSIIHSIVEYKDGSMLAQLGTPDMKIPISYCLGWPDRIESGSERLDLIKMGQLEFKQPDFSLFPCLSLAVDALKTGGSAPLVLNAANEIAVESFLSGMCKFTDIARFVGKVLEMDRDLILPQSLSSLLEMDADVRRQAQALIVSAA